MKGKFSREKKTSFLITILGMIITTSVCLFNIFAFENKTILGGAADELLYLFGIIMVLVGLIFNNTDEDKNVKVAIWTYVTSGILMYALSVARLFFTFDITDYYGIDRILQPQHVILLLLTSSVFILNIVAVWFVVKKYLPMSKSKVENIKVWRNFRISGIGLVILKVLAINSKMLLDSTFASGNFDYLAFNFMEIFFNILYVTCGVWFIFSLVKLFLALLRNFMKN